MDERLKDLRSKKNPEARIKIMTGHFATRNSHLNTYIDMSTVKTRHNNARETAKVIAKEYATTTYIDTIVCVDGTEVIGTFLAEILADTNPYSLSNGNNISVVTPEINSQGQMMFRDNKVRMIVDKKILILTDSLSTGKTIWHAINSVQYYGGDVVGIAAIFSTVTKVQDIEVKSIFKTSDLPGYATYERTECPLCKQGRRVEALVNGFGYSKL
ncbi:MAG: orotate phosphoribosyltransferase [Dorea sp.]|nr:orotate phosphoribosyltransferase [Dorea sp.]